MQLSEQIQQKLIEKIKAFAIPVEVPEDAAQMDVHLNQEEAKALLKDLAVILEPYLDNISKDSEQAGLDKGLHRQNPGWWHTDLDRKMDQQSPEEKDREGETVTISDPTQPIFTIQRRSVRGSIKSRYKKNWIILAPGEVFIPNQALTGWVLEIVEDRHGWRAVRLLPQKKIKEARRGQK